MRRNIEVPDPEINLLVNIHTRNDEEYARTTCSSRQKTTKPEDDSSLVLLDHLDAAPDREGEGDDDQEVGEDGDQGPNNTIFLDNSFEVNSNV